MDRINALGRGAQIMLVGTILLLIDLFFSWQDVDLGGIADEFGVDTSVSGWHGAAGVLLGIVTIVALAWLIVRIASVDIPLPVSTAMTGALLGTLVLIFAIIKILSILGDYTTIWAWVGLGLAIVVAVGAFQVVQEAGGVDQLQGEMRTMTAGSGSGSETAAAPPPTEPAAAAPAAPSEPAPAPPEPAEPPPAEPPSTEPEAPADADERQT